MGLCYTNKNYCLFAAILLDINSQRAVVVVMKSIATKRQVCLTLLVKEVIFPVVLLLVKTRLWDVGPEELECACCKSQTGAFMQMLPSF